MRCFVRVRVLRWQDWEHYFMHECLPQLEDYASVKSVHDFRDHQDPGLFGYMMQYEDAHAFWSFIDSVNFRNLFESRGSDWEIMQPQTDL